MLTTKPRDPKSHVARCDAPGCTCSTTIEAGTDVDARAELERLGWQERARRAQGRALWHWWCPACLPKSSATPSVGWSTALFPPAGASQTSSKKP